MDKIREYHQILKAINGSIPIPATKSDNNSAKELMGTLLKYKK